MSDRDLMELVTKAHGNCKYFNDAWRCAETGYREFNPLDDDGDAMRLAVKLGLRVQVFLDMPFGDYTEAQHESGECFRVGHDDNGGSDNATRLAIVRAAAEIGRNMPMKTRIKP